MIRVVISEKVMALVSEDNTVEFVNRNDFTPIFSTKLVNLVYLLMEAEKDGIPLKVKMDFSQWRGISAA